MVAGQRVRNKNGNWAGHVEDSKYVRAWRGKEKGLLRENRVKIREIPTRTGECVPFWNCRDGGPVRACLLRFRDTSAEVGSHGWL